jgi:hypothetical protein
MESRTNVTVSDHVALPDQVFVLFHSQPSQLFPLAPTTPQFHSLLKVSMPVQLMLDDHNLRGFGITPIWSSHGLGGHLGSKKTTISNVNSRGYAVCCSLCRRPSYMEENGSKSEARQCARNLCHRGSHRHRHTVWIFYYPGKPNAPSTSSLNALIGDAKQIGDETSAAPHFGGYTTRCFV